MLNFIKRLLRIEKDLGSLGTFQGLKAFKQKIG